MLIFLGLLFLILPLCCWGALARSLRVGAPVGAALLLWAGLTAPVLLGLLTVRAEQELYLAYAPAGVLLVLVGVLAERRLLGPRPPDDSGRARGAGITLGAYTVLVGLLAAPAGVFLVLANPFLPRISDLPLPAGARITSETGAAADCAAHYCLRTLEVEGPPGLTRLLDERLAAAGWRPDGHGGRQRPNGWLLDDRPLSVHLTEHDGGVSVELAGSDGFG